MTQGQTDIADLELALGHAGLVVNASELHGGLCGALCAGGAAATATWIEDYLSDSQADVGMLEAAREALRQVGLQTWQCLMGAQLEFSPLLPDDDAALQDRVNALAVWCHGFIHGLGLAGFSVSLAGPRGGTSTTTPMDELTEIISDFAEISRVGLSSAERRDETGADFALAELVEYVRVSVQIVFEELQSVREMGAEQMLLH